MDDRLKLRYWNKSSERFVEPYATRDGVPLYADGSEWDFDYIVSQCTGRKDRNRKDVFEHDIVKVTGSRETSGYGVVEYMQSGCRFVINGFLEYPSPYHTRKKGELFLNLEEWLYLEVIGNIFENKELMKQ